MDTEGYLSANARTGQTV